MMKRDKQRKYRQALSAAALGLTVFMSGCTKDHSFSQWGERPGESKSALTGASSTATQNVVSTSAVVQAQIAAVNDPLNQTAQYALTSQDVALLKDEGLLEDTQDSAELAAMIKR